jgi:hypothetical protein
MTTVYWSPWYPNNSFGSLHLLYDEPVSLLQDIRHQQNKENKKENWFQCHAFLHTVKNTFVLKFPAPITFHLDKDFGVVSTDYGVSDLAFVANKQPSVINAHTFSILNNWIFWSDESLEISSMPAYLHKQVVDGYYVPGSFNINSWFRPLEAAIQLNEGVNFVDIKRNDPMAYVKFHTNEPVVLKRFNLSEELINLSQGCINYKRHEPNKGLSFLYKKFHGNGMSKLISKEIQKSLVD